MGCVCEKNAKRDDGSLNGKNIELQDDKRSPNSTSSTKKNGEITNIKDVRISTANLITEKHGRIQNIYKLLNPPLGKGAYGEVRKAIHKPSGLMRAVKIIHKSQTTQAEQEKLINEVEILKRLDHPNILKVYEFQQDERQFYIVTELCTGGELFEKISEAKQFTEKQAAEIMKQVLSAVFYCHQNKIVHRDLKPENLLYENDKEDANLKVIDFGTSKVFEGSQKLNQRLGTPYYIAPEVLKRKYDQKCDVWSCGVILYILLCGYPPFSAKSDDKIMEKVQKGVYNFDGDEWNIVSEEAKNFIRRMMEYDPQKRYSAEQAINDSWIKKWTQSDEIDMPIMRRTLENMRTFRASQKLQEATLMFLVNFLSTQDEKKELLQAFRRLDTNSDGQLSREELIAGYKKIMDDAQAEEEANRIMQEVDKNNSGAIDYTEFVMATINRQNLLSQQRLETTFKIFDKDGSGALSISEIKEIFGGMNISENIWKEIMKEVDANGDGEISYTEFKEMMLKMLSNDQTAN